MRRGGRHHATSYPVTKICAWVGKSDWQWLQARHPHEASAVLRRLIGNYRRQCEGYEAPEFELESLDLENL